MNSTILAAPDIARMSAADFSFQAHGYYSANGAWLSDSLVSVLIAETIETICRLDRSAIDMRLKNE